MQAKTRGFNYFAKGLLCFVALAYDFIQGFIDKLFFGSLVADRFFDSPWFVLVTHWIFVIIVWGICVVFLFKSVKNMGRKHLLHLKWTSSLKFLIPCAIMASVGLAFLEQLVDPAMMPQIL